jgi:uncharacterized membrane protein
LKKPPARTNPRLEQSPNTTREVEQVQIAMQEWSGPLPHPATLREFGEVVPNGAERIMAAWERETAHRHKMEKSELGWAVFDSVFGKVCALVFVLTALSISAYAAVNGAEWVAAILGGGTIASVVWAFVYAPKVRSK